MSYFSVARAVSVRLMFATHGVIALWRLTLATNDQRYWYLGLVLCLLLVEMTITLGKTGGKEWKWFCPSVFIYLMCIVPTMWFMELYELDKRLNASSAASVSSGNNSVVTITNDSNPCHDSTPAPLVLAQSTVLNESKEDLRAHIGTLMGVKLEIKIPIQMTADQWIRTLEQILLLILILGRWFLPKGKLTHDQLSQLLLVYIGTAADIVEFFEAFKEDQVRNNRLICIVIMGIWSLSLIQFSLVLTATRVRRDRTGLVPHKNNQHLVNNNGCCDSDVYGITVSILFQDLPFLVLRMLLIIRYHVVSYTNMFFTCKNTIVIILLVYRLIVVQVERRRASENPDAGYMLPKFDSSPTISTSHANDKRRRRHKQPDTLSLSTCNTLSTYSSTPGSKIRLIKPYNSCTNIYDVRQPGCGTPVRNHNDHPASTSSRGLRDGAGNSVDGLGVSGNTCKGNGGTGSDGNGTLGDDSPRTPVNLHLNLSSHSTRSSFCGNSPV